MSAPAKQAASAERVDTAIMRQNVSMALGPEDQAAAPPPAPEEIDTLIFMLRDHLVQLIPEVEKKLGQLPRESSGRYCASACVGEARGKLQACPARGPDGEVEYARRLARVLRALLDHFEDAGAPSSQ
ncbi:DUF6415 family natural product biosynthesis protein [Streptomyces murinus]|uniref:DUF6415 family natural product biosynthesis protein n=1 Tax=Streptomyces murinus TaxID=33900 RepID=UPI00117C5D7D|nr:DUF6415 family natural product biosynthesis protein [Streptomyces murinus]WDO05532.1 DUF6415 family natural product biosynthesis protein [Streptomyces murinus]